MPSRLAELYDPSFSFRGIWFDALLFLAVTIDVSYDFPQSVNVNAMTGQYLLLKEQQPFSLLLNHLLHVILWSSGL
jgi:hypothetical protein